MWALTAPPVGGGPAPSLRGVGCEPDTVRGTYLPLRGPNEKPEAQEGEWNAELRLKLSFIPLVPKWELFKSPVPPGPLSPFFAPAQYPGCWPAWSAAESFLPSGCGLGLASGQQCQEMEGEPPGWTLPSPSEGTTSVWRGDKCGRSAESVHAEGFPRTWALPC